MWPSGWKAGVLDGVGDPRHRHRLIGAPHAEHEGARAADLSTAPVGADNVVTPSTSPHSHCITGQ